MNRVSQARGGLARAAALAIVLLALGAAAHFEHHLLGPDCESGPTSSSHPCASCSVLHGGTLAESTVTGIAPTASRPTESHNPGTVAPAATIPGSCAPRGPPLG